MQQVATKQDVDVAMLQPLLTIEDVMKLLGVSRPTVYALIANEGLPYLKMGKSLRFLPMSVYNWLVDHECSR